MADCKLSWNGKESVLFPLLSQQYGTETAGKIYTYINSLEFSAKYGDYKLGSVPVDEVGQEPTLQWLQEEKIPEKFVKITPKQFAGQMTFAYGPNKRSEVKADTTIGAILSGERTATTRYASDGHLDYWKGAQPGDVITFTGKNGERVEVEVTKALHPIPDISAEEWSKKEGWSVEYFNSKVKPKLKQAWQIEYKLKGSTEKVKPIDFTNHSGGAIGADMMWDKVGRELGVTQHRHYWANQQTPGGNVQLTTEQLQEGIQHAKKAATALGRPWSDKYANLLGRNWYQVKNSTQVVAIAPLIKKGERNSKGFISKASRTTVDGGTGYAVEMGIASGKEVVVFDTSTDQWFKWNGTDFVPSSVPVLHKNFAGIGSRQANGTMTPNSIQAIKDAYIKTFNSVPIKVEPFNQDLAQQIEAKLKALYPEIKLTYTNEPILPGTGEVFNQQSDIDKSVDYMLKSVSILSSSKADELFRKGDKNNWSVEKILQELQVPKEQQTLILGYGTRNREDILVKLLADYSYTVEINTAKHKNTGYGTVEWNNEDGYQPNFDEPDNGNEENAKYYSNLTVPGGTNYTENEIATPAITPSIKGHAQFSTDSGIGWFRSDDAEINLSIAPLYKEWKQAVDNDVSDEVLTEINERFNAAKGNGKLNNTRRILEVQSDLFQKGRDKENLDSKVNKDSEYQYRLGNTTYAIANNELYSTSNYIYNLQKLELSNAPIEIQKWFNDRNNISTKENQFLQLLNKDNNWVTFFVKSIIQDSAKKGYEKVLFPSGNTASKVEGHGTLEDFKREKEDRIKELEEGINDFNYELSSNYYFEKDGKYYWEDIQAGQFGEETTKEITKEVYDKGKKGELQKEATQREINQLKQELERVETEGFAALKPIYKFYENTVKNILKKSYPVQEITDEYGNTWNEVTLNSVRDLSPILLQQDKGRIIGQANIQAMSVLIDAIYQKQDTLPHEYAHHYIAWYRDTDIVKEAIAKWGSEEALVQAIGEQAVKQKGDAWTWWKKFVKFIFGDFAKLDKEELKNLLTDAFLTRKNLREKEPKYTSQESISISVSKQRIKSLDANIEGMRSQLRTELVDVALANPTTEYKLDITNPNGKFPDNNGFKNVQYAHMLDDIRRELGDKFPKNLTFFPAFEFAMNASPGRRIALYSEQINKLQEYRKNLPINPESIIEMTLKMEIATVDDEGLTTGTFNKDFGSTLQLEAADSLLGVMYDKFLEVPDTPVDTLLKLALCTAQGNYFQALENKNDTLAKKWKAIYTSFAFPSGDGRLSFTDLLLERFKALGYKVSEDVKNKLLNKYAIDKWDTDIVKKISQNKIAVEGSSTAYPTFSAEEWEQIEAYDQFMNGGVDVQKARGVQDWSTTSFEVDVRDTASVRMKMWLSSQNKMKQGVDQLYPLLNELGLPTKVNLDNLWSSLLNRLSGISELNEEKVLSILEGSEVPDLVQIGRNLKETSQQNRNEFVKVMSLQYAKWVVLKADTSTTFTGEEITKTRVINAQRGAQIQTIIDAWKSQNALSPMTLTKEDDTKVMDVEKAKKHLQFIQAYSLLQDWKYPFTKGMSVEQKATFNQGLEVKFKQAIVGIEDIYSGTLTQLVEDNQPTVGVKETPEEKKARNDKRRSLIGDILTKMFSEYGIDLSPAMMKEITGTTTVMENKKKVYTDKVSLATANSKFKKASFLQQFSFTSNNNPNGIFSAFFGKASGFVLQNDTDTLSQEEEENLIMLNHPLYTETTTMNILASAAASKSDALYSNGHKSIEGKQISDNSMNTALSAQMQLLQQDFLSALQEYEKDTLLNSGFTDAGEPKLDGNWHLNQMKKDTSTIPELQYLEGLSYNSAKKGTTRASMSDREQYLTAINLLLNGGQKKMHLMSLTHSDKTMTPVFYGVNKINVGDEVHKPEMIPLPVQQAFVEMFKGEHRRALVVQGLKGRDSSTGDKKVDDGGTKFYFFEEFNKENLKDAIKATGHQKVDEVYSLLYNESGNLVLDASEFEPYALSIVAHKLQGLIEAQKADWVKNGIDYSLLDSQYVKKMQDKLDSSYKETGWNNLDYNIKNKQTAILQARQDAILAHAAKDFTVNTLLWNMNSATLFYGDPAQTFKKSVEGTQLEYAKRLAKDIAPGQDLSWSTREYKTITIEDAKQFFPYIEKHGSNVTNTVEAANAQEFTSVQEHLDVLMASGLIKDEDYRYLSNKITASWALPESDPNRGYYHFTEIEKKKFGSQGLQPMKPVYAGFRKTDENGLRLYDYVKSSSYPLVPEFTKGSEMDKIRKMMEEKGIQRAVFISGKKIGGPTKNVSLFNEDGTVTIPDSVPTQTLLRKNFRIQQDVPYDEEKEHIKIISQMNKLITEGISEIQGFELNGTTMSGKQIKAKKEELRGLMYKKNLAKLMTSLGSKRIFDEKGKFSWSPVEKRLLIEKLVTTAKERGYSQNEINLLEKFTDTGDFEFPPFLHPAFEKFESLMMSMVAKVSETKIPGKSYVQTSSTGYKITTEDGLDKSQVVFVGDYDGSEPLKHMQLEDGKVIPAQVYAPFNFTYTGKQGQTIKAKIEDYLITVDGRRTLDMDKVPVELLQLVGARIPNQGHNSMIPIEIVGFVPSEMSDTLIVPSAIVEQMGSDFDVDKLYTYKRPYKFVDGKFEPITPATKEDRKKFEDEYQYKQNGDEGNRDIYQDEMDSAWASKLSEDKLAREYVDIHWSILTHPEMYNRILNKLDKPDLKDLNKEYSKKSTEVASFWSAKNQLATFQSGKDAKALVGMTSLAVTFNSVIQDKNLRLGHYEFTKTGTVSVDDSITLNGLKFSKLSGNGRGTNGYSKQDNHTIFQSGAVDNAKERTLDNLNISIATYPAIQVLHQLETKDGQILGTDFSIGMMVQDIIWEYSSRMRQGNDSLSEEYSSDLSLKVYESLKAEFLERLGEEPSTVSLTTEYLNNLWNLKDKDSKQFLEGQLQVLETFRKLTEYGERLTQLQKTLNQDTNGPGPNIIYALQQKKNYEGLNSELGKVFLGEEALIQDTEQNVAFQSTIYPLLQIAETIFPLSAVDTSIQSVAESQGKDVSELSSTVKRDIVRSLRSAMLSSSPTITGESTSHQERIRLQFGTDIVPSLAVRLENYKLTHRDNYFLNRLSTKINTMGKGPDFISYENAKAVRMDEALNLFDFTKLLLSGNKEEIELGEDLIKYALLFTPQNGPNSFVTKIPAGVLLGTSFSTDIRNLFEEFKEEEHLDNFLQQLYQHNPTMALQLKDEHLKGNLESNKIQDRNYPEILSFGQDDEAPFMITVNKEIVPAPYVRYFDAEEGKNILYKLQAVGAYVQYQRIDTLGTKTNQEFDLNSSGVLKSVYSQNNAAFDFGTPSVHTELVNQVNYSILQSPGNSVPVVSWGLGNISNFEDVQEALVNISVDREVPLYLRTLTGNISVGSTVDRRGVDFKLVLDEESQVAGSYNASTNIMTLSKNLSRTGAAETLLHELIHKNTDETLHRLGFTTRENVLKGYTGNDPEGYWQTYKKTAAVFASKNSELAKQATELDRLRYEALTAFQAKIARGEVGEDDTLIAYGLQNLNEFLAMVGTNKELMNFLNQVESSTKEKGAWLQNFIDKVLDFFVELANYLGVTINDNSILKEAYSLAYNFTQESAKDAIRLENGMIEATRLSTTMENEAIRIHDNIESIYGQEATLTDDGTHFHIDVTNYRINTNLTSDEPRVQDALDKMQRQMRTLDSSLLSRPIVTEEDKQWHIQTRHLYNEIKEDARNLQATKDLLALGELGTKQLGWVRDILKSERPHAQEVILATTLIDMWTSLDTMYDNKLGEATPELEAMTGKILGEAKQLYSKVHQFTIESLIKKTENGIKPLTLDSFGKNLKDQSGYRKLGALIDDSNDLIQDLSATVQSALNNVTDARIELQKGMQDIAKTLTTYAKSKGLTTDQVFRKFIQENPEGNAFGLVQKLGAGWYKGNVGTFRNLIQRLQGMDQSSARNNTSAEQTTKQKKLIWKGYWDTMNERGMVIQPALLFNLVTGERLADTEKDYKESVKHYQELLDHAGDKEIVDEAIDEVQKGLKKYFEDEESKRLDIWRRTHLTDPELWSIDLNSDQKAKLTPEEQLAEKARLTDQALTTKRETALRSWMQKNSPMAFLQTKNLDAQETYYFNHTGNNPPRFVPKKGSDMFDNKYQELHDGGILEEVYNQFIELSKEFRGYHPPSMVEELHPNFLPIIKVSDIASSYGLIGQIFKGKFGQEVLNSVSITEYEKLAQYKDEIPLNYSGSKLPRFKDGPKKGEVDLSQVSFDLPKLFETWGSSAIHYRYMSQVQNDIEIVQRLVRDISEKRMADGQPGLPNLAESLKYYKDQAVFQKGMNPEGVLNDPVYSWNPLKDATIKRRIIDINKELKDLKDKLYEEQGMALGSDEEPEVQEARFKVYTDKIEVLESELEVYQKDVRYLAASKAANTTMKIAQLKAMAYNPFSIVSNLAQGLLQAGIHGRAFRADNEDGTTSGDYTVQQFRRGLALVGSMKEKKKIISIMDKLGLIDVMLDTHMKGYKDMDSTAKSNFKKTFDPFAGNKLGDFFTKSGVVVAMLLNKRVEVMQDGEKVSISLLDALGEDGNWDTEKFGENKDWYSKKDKDVNQKEWNKYAEKIKAVSVLVFGHQDPNVVMGYKNSTIGRLVGQFRASWLLSGIDSRFQPKYDNARLGRTVEGRWRTYTKLKGYGVPLLLKQLGSVFTGHNPFEGVESEQVDDEGNKVYRDIQDYEIANMRKNLAGLAYTFAVGSAILLLRGALPDEEERKRRKKNGIDKSDYTRIMLNLMLRSQQDLLTYADPGTAMQLLGNVVPSATVVTDFMRAGKAFTGLMKDDPHKWEKFVLKQTKAWPYLNNWNRLQFYMKRDISATQR